MQLFRRVEVALQFNWPNAACADDGSRAAATATIAVGGLIMIWLEVMDFDRAS
jgi:hypothetical protein